VLTTIQFCAGGFIEGSITIIGIAAMDCVVPELSGSSHGMAGFLAQCMCIENCPRSLINFCFVTVGAFFAGFPFGYLIKAVGWNSAYLILESFALVNILLCSYLLIKNYSSGSTEIAIKKKEQ